MKEDCQKAFKKVTLFFLSSSVLFNKQSYQKGKGSGISGQLLFKLRNKFRKIHLFVMYYLTKFDDFDDDDVIMMWVIPKITSANLCKPIHDINYSTSICPFESEKCGKEGKKIQKFEYLENKKSFLELFFSL